jgi:5-(aminomethyl)-3-furanmethanol phosphate kinase
MAGTSPAMTRGVRYFQYLITLWEQSLAKNQNHHYIPLMMCDLSETARARGLRRAADASRGRLAIVKLGGSHASGPHLKDWLAAIAAEAGAVVIVPGGGPFADAVRSAQASMGYDDSAAHAMALMAMAQFGRALESLNPALQLTASRSAISRALKDGKVPVWSPEPMARAAALPETWALTSDSLAAWLAGALGAHRLVLVKHGRFDAAAVDIHDLVARGVVDPLFPRYLRQSGARAWLASPTESARLAEGLQRPIFPEIVGRAEK